MQLSEEQVARFRRDGFLLFPGLFSKAEIAVLRAETARLAGVEADSVIRERTGGVRSIFRVHEDDGATRSAAFRALCARRACWRRRGRRSARTRCTCITRRSIR